MGCKLVTYFHRADMSDTFDYNQMFKELANDIDDNLKDSAEKTAAIRKLLESRDCIKRIFYTENL